MTVELFLSFSISQLKCWWASASYFLTIFFFYVRVSFFLNQIIFNIKKKWPSKSFFLVFFCQKVTEPFIHNKAFNIEVIWYIKWCVERPVCFLSHKHTFISEIQCKIYIRNVERYWRRLFHSIEQLDIKSRHTKFSCIVGKSPVCIRNLCENGEKKSERDMRGKKKIWLAHNKFHLKGCWTKNLWNGPSNLGYFVWTTKVNTEFDYYWAKILNISVYKSHVKWYDMRWDAMRWDEMRWNAFSTLHTDHINAPIYLYLLCIHL